ncbi:GNAT family N-acetyltransferase (plasmid) [Deinococcus taeanensis]|uniref:GNAT family N-acetyltransferase n=1 Tax=Deinococcus taeanensis TaxID=2737050 RepID=UPI001CDD8E70|nr:GNAT family N-acetyltransferase [Deinococcus taeanensis]UBV44654.1 GNAT family N-acetyltransferase [Deinococcus taeanensis]
MSAAFIGRTVLASRPDGRYVVVQARTEDAPALEAVQRACFPSLSEDEIATARHFLSHQAHFPEGQLAVLDTATAQVVASSSDFRLRVNFAHYAHAYMKETGDNLFTTHDPDGDWLYGADIGVHPDARGQGLATLLYGARHDLIRRLNLKGHVAGAMPKGYCAVADHLPIEQYVLDVIRGERRDPVLSVQLGRGYGVWGIIPDYLDDDSCRNHGVFIVWRNPAHRPGAR